MVEVFLLILGFFSTLTTSTGGERATIGLGGGDILTGTGSICCLDEILEVLSLGGAGESTSPSLLGTRLGGGDGLGATSTGTSAAFLSFDDRLKRRGNRDGDLVGDLGGDFVDVGGDLGSDFGESGGGDCGDVFSTVGDEGGDFEDRFISRIGGESSFFGDFSAAFFFSFLSSFNRFETSANITPFSFPYHQYSF